MEQVGRALLVSFWFGQQAIFVGGLGYHWFFIPALVLAGIAIWRRPRNRAAWLRAAPLLILPVLWLAIGSWASVFWHGQTVEPRKPEWVYDAPTWFLLASAAIVVGTVTFARGARVFAASVGLVALYVILVAWFMTGMAITGTWL